MDPGTHDGIISTSTWHAVLSFFRAQVSALIIEFSRQDPFPPVHDLDSSLTAPLVVAARIKFAIIQFHGISFLLTVIYEITTEPCHRLRVVKHFTDFYRRRRR